MNSEPQVDQADVEEVVAFFLTHAKEPMAQTAEQADLLEETAKGYARQKWPERTDEWTSALAHLVRQKVMWSKPEQSEQ